MVLALLFFSWQEENINDDFAVVWFGVAYKILLFTFFGAIIVLVFPGLRRVISAIVAAFGLVFIFTVGSPEEERKWIMEKPQREAKRAEERAAERRKEEARAARRRKAAKAAEQRNKAATRASEKSSKSGKEFYKKTIDSKKIAWMDKGMNAVKSKLKDGDSAKFRNVYFIRGTKGIPVSCGEVNSKNSFGAYSGFQRFVSGGDVGLTFLEEEVSDDFGNVWKTLCL